MWRYALTIRTQKTEYALPRTSRMPSRTDFLVYATLLIAPTLPLSAEVAYISDCCNNASVIGVFQTSTNNQKQQLTPWKNTYKSIYSSYRTKHHSSNSTLNSLHIYTHPTTHHT